MLQTASHIYGVGFTEAMGSWVWDIQRDQVHADDVAAFLFGLDPGQAQSGRSVAEYEAAIHPDDRDAVTAQFRAAAEEGGIFVAEYRTCPRDGSVRWVLERGHFYHDEAGRPRRAHGIIVDITERKLGGDGFASRPARRAEHPLERAADLCMEAREAVRAARKPFLAKLVDMVLLELGRELKTLMDADRRRRLS
ncbi:hypothetical protein A5481_29150 [Methylobacterium platani]|uniref:histidine kinase n=1 Tax=Methylobacterium platani TaxID=427683 RepID=A0A179S0W8_9HYPH|nr:hypothetical protein A5481_29150 [Methylobacterium platani]